MTLSIVLIKQHSYDKTTTTTVSEQGHPFIFATDIFVKQTSSDFANCWPKHTSSLFVQQYSC